MRLQQRPRSLLVRGIKILLSSRYDIYEALVGGWVTQDHEEGVVHACLQASRHPLHTVDYGRFTKSQLALMQSTFRPFHGLILATFPPGIGPQRNRLGPPCGQVTRQPAILMPTRRFTYKSVIVLSSVGGGVPTR